MKAKITLLILALTTSFALAHGGVEIGPHGGRLLEFSKNETMNGEVTLKEGKFHVALLDKNMKAVPVTAQSLTVTSGTAAKPEKVTIEKSATGFSFPAVKEGSLLIFQFRGEELAKPITARFTYDVSNCEKCQSPEWLCKCSANNKAGKK